MKGVIRVSNHDDDIEELIERSSLGSAAARQLRRRTAPVQVAAVRRIADLRNRMVHPSRPGEAADAAAALVHLLQELGYHGQAERVLREAFPGGEAHAVTTLATLHAGDRPAPERNDDDLSAPGGSVVGAGAGPGQTFNIGALHANNVVFGNRSRAGDSYTAGDDLDQNVEPGERRRRAFIAYGPGDEPARAAMFDFLRALDLQPLDWEELIASDPDPAPRLDAVVARGLSLAQVVIVVLTPQDLAGASPQMQSARTPGDLGTAARPRSNLLLELGIALGGYPDRTVVVEFGRLRLPAELAARNRIRFDGSSTPLGRFVCQLKEAGCAVDDRGGDWRKTDRFAELAARWSE